MFKGVYSPYKWDRSIKNLFFPKQGRAVFVAIKSRCRSSEITNADRNSKGVYSVYYRQRGILLQTYPIASYVFEGMNKKIDLISRYFENVPHDSPLLVWYGEYNNWYEGQN